MGVLVQPSVERKGRLLALLVLTVCAAAYFFVARDTFLSARLYDALPQIVVFGLILCSAPWFALVLKRYWTRRATSSPLEVNGKELGPLSALWYAAFLGLVMGFLALMMLLLAGMLIVAATSYEPVQVSPQVLLSKGGGKNECRYMLAFYNQPLGRDVRTCAGHWHVAGIKSGDTLLVEERFGPFGARVIDLRRQQP